MRQNNSDQLKIDKEKKACANELSQKWTMLEQLAKTPSAGANWHTLAPFSLVH